MRKDRHGHYAALNLSADAAPEEIELSFRMLKRSYQERRTSVNIAKVQTAYEVLSDPRSRREYDNLGQRKASSSLMSQPVILGILLVVLIFLVVILHGAEIRARMTQFEPGDTLYLRADGQFFGTVQAFESQHVFFNGAQAPAYLIENTPGSEGEWYPARDLTRLCRGE